MLVLSLGLVGQDPTFDMALIVPSLLAFDLARLDEAVELIERAGPRRVHVDVCDGHFAPGITLGQPVIESLRKATGIQLEVHLRVERPERFAGAFVDAGANLVAIHPESTARLRHALHEIGVRGAKRGLVLNSSTSVEAVTPVLNAVDCLILFSEGPEFDLAGLVHAVRSSAAARERCGIWFEIAVEGALDPDRVRSLEEVGADAFVPIAASASNREAAAHIRELIRCVSAGSGTIAH
ncbi:MAG: ribulose-phosphate 3-epimerase [Terriglobia bacterium]